MSITSSAIGKRTFKVIFLGDTNTGKTSIIERFVNNKFEDKENPTIGIDFLGKNVHHKNTTCRLQLWDTAGQQRFRSLIPTYLKDAICAIFVFDLSKPQSLENIEMWINLFYENKSQKSITILCGSKSDLEKQCTQNNVKRIAQKHKMFYFQTSAKNGSGIDQMFHSLIQNIIDIQKKKKKKFEEIDVMPPLTNDSLKSSTTGEPVSVRLKNRGENIEQVKQIGQKKRCCF